MWTTEKQKTKAYKLLKKLYGDRFTKMSIYDKNTAMYQTLGRYKKTNNFVLKGEK